MRARAALRGSRDGLEHLADLLDRHLVGETVTAQEQPVPRVHVQLPQVDVHVRADAEGPGEDVAVRVDLGLGLGHLAVADPLLGQAVVGGDLSDPAARHEVGAGVADVGQAHHVAAVGADGQAGRGERGAHPPQPVDPQALLPDRPVRGDERLPQAGHGGVAVVGALERLDGEPRRHLAAAGPAHAVGDREEGVPGRGPVFVALAGPSDVGGHPRTQHRHRRTSKTVAPIWSRSPLASLEGWEMRSELT